MCFWENPWNFIPTKLYDLTVKEDSNHNRNDCVYLLELCVVEENCRVLFVFSGKMDGGFGGLGGMNMDGGGFGGGSGGMRNRMNNPNYTAFWNQDTHR